MHQNKPLLEVQITLLSLCIVDYFHYLCTQIRTLIGDMRNRMILVALALFPLMALAEGEGSKTSQNAIVKGVMWVKTLIDSMAVANVDRSYIEQPERPWAVEVRSAASQSTLKMNADWSFEGLMDGWMTTKTDNGFSASLGAWLGYRGYGFGWSKELKGGDGSTLSFGAMGGSFGINLRINTYRSRTPDIYAYFGGTEAAAPIVEHADLEDPIRVRSLFLDGYYLFNGKHFSYAAAYDQSLIQRRSAGSLIAGLMYYHSTVAFDEDSNWPLVVLMRNVGKLKFTQANVGAGYAYNWVPARGWLVSAQAMPMVTFYNRMKTYFYDIHNSQGTSIYRKMMDDPDYNPEESNDRWVMDEVEKVKTTNRVSWNFDARMSVVYNWSNCYLRVYGHYNRFRYSNDEGDGRQTDWTAYASLGIRF